MINGRVVYYSSCLLFCETVFHHMYRPIRTSETVFHQIYKWLQFIILSFCKNYRKIKKQKYKQKKIIKSKKWKVLRTPRSGLQDRGHCDPRSNSKTKVRTRANNSSLYGDSDSMVTVVETYVASGNKVPLLLRFVSED